MLHQLTAHIYVSDYEEENDRPRLGYIKGSKFAIMVDAGNSPAHAQMFLDELKNQGLKAPDFVILTHWHWDHVYGLTHLTMPSICSAQTQAKLIEMSHWKWDTTAMQERLVSGEDIAFCDTCIKLEYPDPLTIKVKTADIIFDKFLNIDLGDLSVLVLRLDNDHAQDSSIIFNPEEKVIFLGDITSPNYHAGPEHYTLDGITKLMDALDELNFDNAIHGHTEVMSKQAWMDWLEEERLKLKKAD